MPKLLTVLVLCAPLVAFVSCSDDDGSDVPRNSMSAGAGGQGGSSTDAGSGGAPGGASGASGMAGGGAGGTSSCPSVILDGGFPEPPITDAGITDAGTSDAGDLDASTNGGGNPGVVSFALDIRPIFVASCSPCHFDEGNGGHNVASDDLPTAYAEAVALGETLVDRVNGGGMPPSYADPPNNCEGNPGDPGCLTVAEVELIQTWLDQCTPR